MNPHQFIVHKLNPQPNKCEMKIIAIDEGIIGGEGVLALLSVGIVRRVRLGQGPVAVRAGIGHPPARCQTHSCLNHAEKEHTPRDSAGEARHASIAITLDTYSHVSPGLQAAAAKSFDEAFPNKYTLNQNEAVK